MSRVFAAQDVRLGRAVVVKVLPPEMTASVNEDRFEREIHLAAKLQHPHIVPLLSAGVAGDLLYYVMPHIEGESLRERLARERELPIPETLRILRDVCNALAYAHGRGIVHRDVKPANVLLSGKYALVTDFGVAKAVAESTGGTTLTSMGVALGTPAYMAPEQASADPTTDHRADLYAVGVMGYEMLTGRPPFTAASPQAVLAAHLTVPPEPVTLQRDSVPPPLAALVMGCLAKHPADRPQTAEELVAQLEAMATPTAGFTPTGGQEPISSGTAAAIRRAHPARVACLFALASAGVLALVSLLVRLLGLPDWAFAVAVGLLAAGLPIMLWTGVIERRRAIARATGRTPVPSGVQRWFTWRRALLGGVSAFGVLGLGTAVYMAMRLLGIGPVGTLVASGVLAKRDRLVLADFENRTADTTLGRSVGEAFRVDLTQSPVVRLLDAAAVGDALRRMGRDPRAGLDLAVARELAQREGAKAVVHGKIDPVGRGYVLTAELLGAADGAELLAVRETARDDGAIIDAVDRLSKRLRERIGESLKTIRASEPLERVTTGSLEALRKYSEGVRQADAGDFGQAVTTFREAVTLDAGFAMAYRKLAVVLHNTFAAPSQIAAAASKAFQYRDRLPPAERYLASAFYYDVVEHDHTRVESAYRSLLALAPDQDIALNNLAQLLNSERRFAEAESLALRADALTLSPPTWFNTLTAQVGQGKSAEVEKTLAEFAERAPRHRAYLYFRTFFAGSRRAYDSVEVHALRLLNRDKDLPRQALALAFWFAAQEVRGKLAAAEQAIRGAMTVDEQRGLPGSYVADAVSLAWLELRFRNRPSAARAAVEEALRRYPLGKMAAGDRPYSDLAFFYASAGQVDRAKALLGEYATSVPEQFRRADSVRHAAQGAIALAEGRVQDAIMDYRAWFDSSGCATCGLYELGTAFERAKQPDSALAAYERAVSTPGWYRWQDEEATLASLYKRLGELYEQRGDVAQARDYYGRFVNLWRTADPELQPVVSDIRARLARLAGEPRR
jgi:eukaryotic-like serine/threonine-protein kinase